MEAVTRPLEGNNSSSNPRKGKGKKSSSSSKAGNQKGKLTNTCQICYENKILYVSECHHAYCNKCWEKVVNEYKGKCPMRCEGVVTLTSLKRVVYTSEDSNFYDSK